MAIQDTMAELRVRLRELHKQVGRPSHDELKTHADWLGRKLPTSTTNNLLNGPQRSRWITVETFVLACQRHAERGKKHLPADSFDLDQWQAAYDQMPGVRARQSAPDDEEEGTGPSAPAAPRPAVMPKQLPSAPRWFTGRHDELAALTAALDAGTGAGGTVVISAIGGTGGIGKTDLALAGLQRWKQSPGRGLIIGNGRLELGFQSAARRRWATTTGGMSGSRCRGVHDQLLGPLVIKLHWAHANVGLFPDGQLHVNLRGFDPSGQPLAPPVAVRGFIEALGVEEKKIPASLDAQVGLYRSLVAGRRILVILDNARDVAQVEPLLPGSPSCAVLVTSRNQLAALQVHGAALLDLDLLSEQESRELLANQLGEASLAAEPGAVTDFLHFCAGLPLALRIAAARVAMHPNFPLAVLADELRDASARLDALNAGDPAASLRATFSWSYAALDPEVAGLFRLLGVAPGPDISLPSAASLTAQSTAKTRVLLRKLERAYLVQQHMPGRYRMHDLVRLYAAEEATHEEAGSDQREALTRLFDHYLGMAAAAMDTAFPAERHRRPRIKASASTAPMFPDSTHAVAWLKGERPNLVAVIAHTAECGWPSHAIRLAATIRRYLDTYAHYTDALAVHGHALRAARDEDDRAGEGEALHNLGTACWYLGRYDDALDDLRQALAVRRGVGDHAGEANTLDNLGGVYWGLGRHEEALDHYRQALTLNHEVRERASEGRTHNNLGVVYVSLGRYEEAVNHLEQALALAREMGDRPAEGTLNNLGVAYERLGRYAEALRTLEQALGNSRETGFREAEAATLDSLGVVHLRLGHYDEALDHHQQALTLSREIDSRGLEAQILNNLGETLKAAERPDDALANHQSALAVSREIGNLDQEARALDGMAQVLLGIGRTQDARRHWQDALVIYDELTIPEASAVRAHLAALDHARKRQRRPTGPLRPLGRARLVLGLFEGAPRVPPSGSATRAALCATTLASGKCQPPSRERAEPPRSLPPASTSAIAMTRLSRRAWHHDSPTLIPARPHDSRLLSGCAWLTRALGNEGRAQESTPQTSSTSKAKN